MLALKQEVEPVEVAVVQVAQVFTVVASEVEAM